MSGWRPRRRSVRGTEGSATVRLFALLILVIIVPALVLAIVLWPGSQEPTPPADNPERTSGSIAVTVKNRDTYLNHFLLYLNDRLHHPDIHCGVTGSYDIWGGGIWVDGGGSATYSCEELEFGTYIVEVEMNREVLLKETVVLSSSDWKATFYVEGERAGDEDDGDGTDTGIDRNRWIVSTPFGISAHVEGGSLIISGTRDGGGDWVDFSTHSYLRSWTRFRGARSISVQSSVAGAGSGYNAGLVLYQDDNNMIRFYQLFDGGVRNVIGGVEYRVAGQWHYQTFDDTPIVEGRWHSFEIDLQDGNTADFILDGRLIGSISISLSEYSIQLLARTSDAGDSIDARFDNVVVDGEVFDDFENNGGEGEPPDTGIEVSRWVVATPFGITARVEEGVLAISGTRDGGGDWVDFSTQSYLRTRERFIGSHRVSVRSAVSGEGSGFDAGLVLYQDDRNMIRFTQLFDAGYRNVIGRVEYEVGGVWHYQTLDARPIVQDAWHRFEIRMLDGATEFWLDGNMIGTISFTLPDYAVQLLARTSDAGDSIHARFDDVIVDGEVLDNFEQS